MAIKDFIKTPFFLSKSFPVVFDPALKVYRRRTKLLPNHLYWKKKLASESHSSWELISFWDFKYQLLCIYKEEDLELIAYPGFNKWSNLSSHPPPPAGCAYSLQRSPETIEFMDLGAYKGVTIAQPTGIALSMGVLQRITCLWVMWKNEKNAYMKTNYILLLEAQGSQKSQNNERPTEVG